MLGLELLQSGPAEQPLPYPSPSVSLQAAVAKLGVRQSTKTTIKSPPIRLTSFKLDIESPSLFGHGESVEALLSNGLPLIYCRQEKNGSQNLPTGLNFFRSCRRHEERLRIRSMRTWGASFGDLYSDENVAGEQAPMRRFQLPVGSTGISVRGFLRRSGRRDRN